MLHEELKNEFTNMCNLQMKNKQKKNPKINEYNKYILIEAKWLFLKILDRIHGTCCQMNICCINGYS